MHSLLYNHLIKNSAVALISFPPGNNAGTKEYWIDACTVRVWLLWLRCTSKEYQSSFEAIPPVSSDGRYYIGGHSSLKIKISLANYTFLESVIAGLHFDMHFFIFRPTLEKNYVKKTIFYHDKRNHFPRIIKKNIWE